MSIALLRRWPRRLAHALAGSFALAAFASDHADPMSLNVFKLQENSEANITDLHAFVVDADGRPLPASRPPGAGDSLLVSLCMRRALTPDDTAGLALQGYRFRLHIDLDPPVRFHDPARTRSGADYAAELARRKAALAHAADDTARAAARQALGELLAEHHTDASLQALYGGIVTQPAALAEEVQLEFQLDLVAVEKQFEARLAAHRIEGLTGAVNVVAPLAPGKAFRPGTINLQAGIFDDPFIFPRFFRRNVVGVVASIPLAQLRRPDGSPAYNGPIALWATTHQGKQQIDHVGRSLRTQLPRFGYLNDKHPSRHVEAILKVHDQPSLMHEVLATFIAPLIAHRHYDSAPDVMLYDLRQPARFPNGRRFDDDIARTLADAGETLLLELSYAESRQFPRATTNDKPFSSTFPFLAPRWTKEEISAARDPGATTPLPPGASNSAYEIPRAPDSGAIARPNFGDEIWRSLWQGEALALLLFGVLLLLAVRTKAARVGVFLVAVVGFMVIHPIRAETSNAPNQPAEKIRSVVLGGGVIVILALGWVYALGRRHGTRFPLDPRDDRQGQIPDDRQPARLTFDEVKHAVFANPYTVEPWGSPKTLPLPHYRLTVGSLVRGILKFSRYPFLDASRRTLTSHADLRWGADKLGFRRLLHPNGIMLAGEWHIDRAPPGAAYTGYFASGKKGRVLARYSTCCTETRAGRYRSLALVAKIYPVAADDSGQPTRPASLITQEDIGGTVTDSIGKAVLENSPPVTPLARRSGILAFLVTVLTLTKADEQPAERQLYEIAELEKDPDVPTSCPRFLRLKVSPSTPLPHGTALDFRDEIMGTLYSPGASTPKGKLIFDLEVSDTGERTGVFNQRLRGQAWTRIGTLTFDHAAASYNGDFVVHFRHPPWRTDRNDPRSVSRGARGA